MTEDIEQGTIYPIVTTWIILQMYLEHPYHVTWNFLWQRRPAAMPGTERALLKLFWRHFIRHFQCNSKAWSSVTFLALGGTNDISLIIACFGVTSLSMKLKNRVCCVVSRGLTIKLRKSSVVGKWTGHSYGYNAQWGFFSFLMSFSSESGCAQIALKMTQLKNFVSDFSFTSDEVEDADCPSKKPSIFHVLKIRQRAARVRPG